MQDLNQATRQHNPGYCKHDYMVILVTRLGYIKFLAQTSAKLLEPGYITATIILMRKAS